MRDETKVAIGMVVGSLIIFISGFVIGDKSHDRSPQEELTELSIELTKLEIKRLKAIARGEHNGS